MSTDPAPTTTACPTMAGESEADDMQPRSERENDLITTGWNAAMRHQASRIATPKRAIVRAAKRLSALEESGDMDRFCETLNGNTPHWPRDKGPLDIAMAREILRLDAAAKCRPFTTAEPDERSELSNTSSPTERVSR